MVANARDFLFAIKESTHTVFDADGAEYLDALRDGMSQSLDASSPHLHQHERDSIFFFEGMLRGVQIKLTAKKQKAAALLAESGFKPPDA